MRMKTETVYATVATGITGKKSNPKINLRMKTTAYVMEPVPRVKVEAEKTDNRWDDHAERTGNLRCY